MPFFRPWTDGIGKPGFVDEFVSFHLSARETWRAEKWHLLLGAWEGDAIAGTQAAELIEPHTVETGSWLGQRYQGRGLGTEMRAAVLTLVFDGLGIDTATSGAIAGNAASAGVSQKLGYEPAGEKSVAPRGVPVREQRFRLSRARWQSHSHPPVEIDGLAPCLPLFGR
jgi:RimJ/RimL family protein N-acetyltransferase